MCDDLGWLRSVEHIRCHMMSYPEWLGSWECWECWDLSYPEVMAPSTSPTHYNRARKAHICSHAMTWKWLVSVTMRSAELQSVENWLSTGPLLFKKPQKTKEKSSKIDSSISRNLSKEDFVHLDCARHTASWRRSAWRLTARTDRVWQRFIERFLFHHSVPISSVLCWSQPAACFSCVLCRYAVLRQWCSSIAVSSSLQEYLPDVLLSGGKAVRQEAVCLMQTPANLIRT